jgi:hypothetical protein
MNRANRLTLPRARSLDEQTAIAQGWHGWEIAFSLAPGRLQQCERLSRLSAGKLKHGIRPSAKDIDCDPEGWHSRLPRMFRTLLIALVL